ncbi:hypothetical protein FF1_000595 [Malus domestica]
MNRYSCFWERKRDFKCLTECKCHIWLPCDFRQIGNPLGDHDIGLFSIMYGLLGHDVPAYLQSNLFENTRADP